MQQIVLLLVVILAFCAMQRQRSGLPLIPDVFSMMPSSSRIASSRDTVSLASQLRERGWKLYGADWCGWTKRQMQIFDGQDTSGLYVECGSGGNTACAGINGFPTWKHASGTTMPGYKDEAALQSMLSNQ